MKNLRKKFGREVDHLYYHILPLRERLRYLKQLNQFMIKEAYLMNYKGTSTDKKLTV